MSTSAAHAAERIEMLAHCKHPDPLDPNVRPPDHDSWSPRRKAALSSHEMRLFRNLLSLEGEPSLRDAVLNDVETFFDQAMRRRLNPEEFLKARSWALNLLWYAYLQPEGFTYPMSVAIVRTLPAADHDAVHLDFGAGVGVTSQLFQRLGYTTVLADAEPTLLEFARFRLDRRRQPAQYLNLLTESLDEDSYDVITAIDTLSYVSDINVTLAKLHRALRPGGVLFANFPHFLKDGDTGGWPLHHQGELRLRHRLQRTGFEPVEMLDGAIIKYVSVDPGTSVHRLRGIRDSILMIGPLRLTYRRLRARLRGR